MDSTETLTVSAVVVALTSLVKWWGEQGGFLDAKRAPIVLVVLSLLGVGLWAFSQPSWERADAFDLFAGWANVLLNSAGVYGFTRATGAALAQFTPTVPPSGAGSEGAEREPFEYPDLSRAEADALVELVGRVGPGRATALLEREATLREHGRAAVRDEPPPQPAEGGRAAFDDPPRRPAPARGEGRGD